MISNIIIVSICKYTIIISTTMGVYESKFNKIISDFDKNNISNIDVVIATDCSFALDEFTELLNNKIFNKYKLYYFGSQQANHGGGLKHQCSNDNINDLYDNFNQTIKTQKFNKNKSVVNIDPVLMESKRLFDETNKYQLVLIITDNNISLNTKLLIELKNNPVAFLCLGIGKKNWSDLKKYNSLYNNFKFFEYNKYSTKKNKLFYKMYSFVFNQIILTKSESLDTVIDVYLRGSTDSEEHGPTNISFNMRRSISLHDNKPLSRDIDDVLSDDTQEYILRKFSSFTN